MIILPKGYTRALTTVDDTTYMGFYNDKGELEGFRKLYNKDEFLKALERVETYKFPKYIPRNVEELQRECASIYNLIKDAFDVKQFALAAMMANPESESSKKNIFNSSSVRKNC